MTQRAMPGGSSGRRGKVPPRWRAWNVTRGSSVADTVEPATSFGGRFMGLMGRRSLPAGRGLWLAGTNNIHMFFMRFPIDAVFLARPGPDGRRRVVAIRSGLRPWTGIVWYVRGADSCLELAAGAAGAAGTVAGDLVAFEGEDAAPG